MNTGKRATVSEFSGASCIDPRSRVCGARAIRPRRTGSEIEIVRRSPRPVCTSGAGVRVAGAISPQTLLR